MRDGLILGIGEGAIGLIKSGLIQSGKISKADKNSPFVVSNNNGKFTSTMVEVKVVSKLSPWVNEMELGQVYTVPIATKEGRIVLGANANALIDNGQIAIQFASMNPTGSDMAVESLTSLDGRILGTLTSIDRAGEGIYKNIEVQGKHRIFESGIKYFI